MQDESSKDCCASRPAAAPPFFQSLATYKPLVVATGLSLTLATALALSGQMSWMNGAMGFFFCFIAFLKLLDVNGFATGFAQYDILARCWSGYGRLYPFLEAALGISYVAGFFPVVTNVATLVLMAIGNVGVWQVIRSGRVVQCVCAGAGFNLPVGRVTFVENAIMGLMALASLTPLV